MFSFTCIFLFYFNSDLSKFVSPNFLADFGLELQYFCASSFIFPVEETGVITAFALRGTVRYSYYGTSTWEILNERGHKQKNNLEAESHQC